MTRKYSSTSVVTTLANGIASNATSMTVATGTGSSLMGGVSLTAGNVDQFTLAIDHDTINEEIVFVTGVSSDTLTIVRGQSGTSAITHSGGATVKHVLTSNDLAYFTSGVDGAVTPTGTQTLTNKTIAVANNTITGLLTATSTDTLTNKTISSANNTLTGVVTLTGAQTLTDKTIDSASNTLTGVTTLTGTQTLTNKTLTSPTVSSGILVGPEERFNIVASAATGTINIDALTAGVWYYTTNATANHTLNFRGNSSTTLNSALTTNDSITILWLNTNGTTAYYPSAFQIDGTSVTPKWSGGTAPSAGNASSIDAYSFTIIKTASATFTVLAAGAVKYV